MHNAFSLALLLLTLHGAQAAGSGPECGTDGAVAAAEKRVEAMVLARSQPKDGVWNRVMTSLGLRDAQPNATAYSEAHEGLAQRIALKAEHEQAIDALEEPLRSAVRAIDKASISIKDIDTLAMSSELKETWVKLQWRAKVGGSKVDPSFIRPLIEKALRWDADFWQTRLLSEIRIEESVSSIGREQLGYDPKVYWVHAQLKEAPWARDDAAAKSAPSIPLTPELEAWILTGKVPSPVRTVDETNSEGSRAEAVLRDMALAAKVNGEAVRKKTETLVQKWATQAPLTRVYIDPAADGLVGFTPARIDSVESSFWGGMRLRRLRAEAEAVVTKNSGQHFQDNPDITKLEQAARGGGPRDRRNLANAYVRAAQRAVSLRILKEARASLENRILPTKEIATIETRNFKLFRLEVRAPYKSFVEFSSWHDVGKQLDQLITGLEAKRIDHRRVVDEIKHAEMDSVDMAIALEKKGVPVERAYTWDPSDSLLLGELRPPEGSVSLGHSFVVDRTSVPGQEVIIDPAYKSLFIPGSMAHEPEVFVGTYKELEALFKRNADKFDPNIVKRVKGPVNPVAMAEATYGYGDGAKLRKYGGEDRRAQVEALNSIAEVKQSSEHDVHVFEKKTDTGTELIVVASEAPKAGSVPPKSMKARAFDLLVKTLSHFDARNVELWQSLSKVAKAGKFSERSPEELRALKIEIRQGDNYVSLTGEDILKITQKKDRLPENFDSIRVPTELGLCVGSVCAAAASFAGLDHASEAFFTIYNLVTTLNYRQAEAAIAYEKFKGKIKLVLGDGKALEKKGFHEINVEHEVAALEKGSKIEKVQDMPLAQRLQRGIDGLATQRSDLSDALVDIQKNGSEEDHRDLEIAHGKKTLREKVEVLQARFTPLQREAILRGGVAGDRGPLENLPKKSEKPFVEMAVSKKEGDWLPRPKGKKSLVGDEVVVRRQVSVDGVTRKNVGVEVRGTVIFDDPVWHIFTFVDLDGHVHRLSPSDINYVRSFAIREGDAKWSIARTPRELAKALKAVKDPYVVIPRGWRYSGEPTESTAGRLRVDAHGKEVRYMFELPDGTSHEISKDRLAEKEFEIHVTEYAPELANRLVVRSNPDAVDHWVENKTEELRDLVYKLRLAKPAAADALQPILRDLEVPNRLLGGILYEASRFVDLDTKREYLRYKLHEEVYGDHVIEALIEQGVVAPLTEPVAYSDYDASQAKPAATAYRTPARTVEKTAGPPLSTQPWVNLPLFEPTGEQSWKRSRLPENLKSLVGHEVVVRVGVDVSVGHDNPITTMREIHGYVIRDHGTEILIIDEAGRVRTDMMLSKKVVEGGESGLPKTIAVRPSDSIWEVVTTQKDLDHAIETYKNPFVIFSIGVDSQGPGLMGSLRIEYADGMKKGMKKYVVTKSDGSSVRFSNDLGGPVHLLDLSKAVAHVTEQSPEIARVFRPRDATESNQYVRDKYIAKLMDASVKAEGARPEVAAVMRSLAEQVGQGNPVLESILENARSYGEKGGTYSQADLDVKLQFLVAKLGLSPGRVERYFSDVAAALITYGVVADPARFPSSEGARTSLVSTEEKPGVFARGYDWLRSKFSMKKSNLEQEIAALEKGSKIEKVQDMPFAQRLQRGIDGLAAQRHDFSDALVDIQKRGSEEDRRDIEIAHGKKTLREKVEVLQARFTPLQREAILRGGVAGDRGPLENLPKKRSARSFVELAMRPSIEEEWLPRPKGKKSLVGDEVAIRHRLEVSEPEGAKVNFEIRGTVVRDEPAWHRLTVVDENGRVHEIGGLGIQTVQSFAIREGTAKLQAARTPKELASALKNVKDPYVIISQRAGANLAESQDFAGHLRVETQGKEVRYTVVGADGVPHEIPRDRLAAKEFEIHVTEYSPELASRLVTRQDLDAVEYWVEGKTEELRQLVYDLQITKPAAAQALAPLLEDLEGSRRLGRILYEASRRGESGGPVYHFIDLEAKRAYLKAMLAHDESRTFSEPKKYGDHVIEALIEQGVVADSIRVPHKTVLVEDTEAQSPSPMGMTAYRTSARAVETGGPPLSTQPWVELPLPRSGDKQGWPRPENLPSLVGHEVAIRDWQYFTDESGNRRASTRETRGYVIEDKGDEISIVDDDGSVSTKSRMVVIKSEPDLADLDGGAIVEKRFAVRSSDSTWKSVTTLEDLDHAIETHKNPFVIFSETSAFGSRDLMGTLRIERANGEKKYVVTKSDGSSVRISGGFQTPLTRFKAHITESTPEIARVFHPRNLLESSQYARDRYAAKLMDASVASVEVKGVYPDLAAAMRSLAEEVAGGNPRLEEHLEFAKAYTDHDVKLQYLTKVLGSGDVTAKRYGPEVASSLITYGIVTDPSQPFQHDDPHKSAVASEKKPGALARGYDWVKSKFTRSPKVETVVEEVRPPSDGNDPLPLSDHYVKMAADKELQREIAQRVDETIDLSPGIIRNITEELALRAKGKGNKYYSITNDLSEDLADQKAFLEYGLQKADKIKARSIAIANESVRELTASISLSHFTDTPISGTPDPRAGVVAYRTDSPLGYGEHQYDVQVPKGTRVLDLRSLAADDMLADLKSLDLKNGKGPHSIESVREHMWRLAGKPEIIIDADGKQIIIKDEKLLGQLKLRPTEDQIQAAMAQGNTHGGYRMPARIHLSEADRAAIHQVEEVLESHLGVPHAHAHHFIEALTFEQELEQQQEQREKKKVCRE